jgi:hypothetical protein
VPGIKGNVDVNIYNGDFQHCNLLPYNRSCLVKYLGASTSTIVAVGSDYHFNLLGGKKDFHHPSREEKGNKIYDFLSTMKCYKNEKAIIQQKNRTDFELAKLTVTPIHSCL